MLSLCELRRAAKVIQESCRGSVLKRITQQDALTLILTLNRSGHKSHLLLTCKPNFARICAAHTPRLMSTPGSFYEYARAHLAGSQLSGVEVAEHNRQLDFHLQSKSGFIVLVFSILGSRSNLYLLDADSKLLHSMRALEETRQELKLGEIWKYPRGRLQSEGSDRWETVQDSHYLQAVAAAYDELEHKQEAERLGQRIANVVKRETAFLSRKATNLLEDLGKALQAETTRQQGELLKSVLHTIKPGDDRVLATEFQTGQVVEIPLDPKISPSDNMKSYFARYQKEIRGETIIRQQLEDVQEAQGAMEEIEQRLQDVLNCNPIDIGALEDLASRKTIRRLLQRNQPKPKPAKSKAKAKQKKEIPSRLLPKRYRTQDGLEIWVGRSDDGNDYLTTRLARGNDLFFHLEGHPGSHVVLRTEGRLDPSTQSLLDACELAVHFSKLKNATRADVHVAPIKNVKKPKGAKSGLVFVRKGKTIHLKRDSKRLQNILASRSD